MSKVWSQDKYSYKIHLPKTKDGNEVVKGENSFEKQ